jgi:general secretion pathway protein G
MKLLIVSSTLLLILGSAALATERDSAKKQKTKIAMNHIENILATYRKENSRYPTTLEGLSALFPSNSENQAEGAAALVDGYGSHFRYESNGAHYVLTSFGRDRAEGGCGLDQDIIRKR